MEHWNIERHVTTNVVEVHSPKEIQSFERDLVEAHRVAYMETVREDDEIVKRTTPAAAR